MFTNTLDRIVHVISSTDNDYLRGTLSWTVSARESESICTALSIKREGGSVGQALKSLVCEEGSLQVSCYVEQVYCTLGTWQVCSTLSEPGATPVSRATIAHLQRGMYQSAHYGFKLCGLTIGCVQSVSKLIVSIPKPMTSIGTLYCII